MQVTFKIWQCEVEFHSYANGQPAILLTDSEDGSPVATATVALPLAPRPDAVWIKDYSENKGMAQALIDAGVIEEKVITVVTSGFVRINQYALTPEALLEQAAQQE